MRYIPRWLLPCCCLAASACIPLTHAVHAVSGDNVPAKSAPARPSKFTSYFDSQRAWADMKAQLDCGFRVPMTPGAAKCQKYLLAQLKASCDTVEVQHFAVPRQAGQLQMNNLIGRFGVDKPRRILLMAHWDTRPTADMNPPGLRDQPIPGANDGASGVAVLLELARVFQQKAPSVGVDIVLVDGEDYGPKMTMMFLGAKHFAAQLRPEQVAQYNYGVLLDMIGDAGLDIHPEAISESVGEKIYQGAVAVSTEMGYNCFKQRGGYEVFDDHLPLIEKGIRIYDFIDFNYPAWHTTDDKLEKCSAASLEAVGRTLENMVYQLPSIYGADSPLAPRTIPGGWR